MAVQTPFYQYSRSQPRDCPGLQSRHSTGLALSFNSFGDFYNSNTNSFGSSTQTSGPSCPFLSHHVASPQNHSFHFNIDTNDHSQGAVSDGSGSPFTPSLMAPNPFPPAQPLELNRAELQNMNHFDDTMIDLGSIDDAELQFGLEDTDGQTSNWANTGSRQTMQGLPMPSDAARGSAMAFMSPYHAMSTSLPTGPGMATFAANLTVDEDEFFGTKMEEDPSFTQETWPAGDSLGLGSTENAAPPKKRPGRNRPLTEGGRNHAALMRRRKACKNCKAARCRCSFHDPCRPCVLRLGAAILKEPCREPLIPSCLQLLLPSDLRWCPSPRQISDFFGTNFQTSNNELRIPINFQFGPSMVADVRVVRTPDTDHWEHLHWVHSWPPTSHEATLPISCKHTVFPAVFSNTTRLAATLNQHLEVLIKREHICHSSLFANKSFSPLGVLYTVYEHYIKYDPRFSPLLKAALKILVLVHACGDTSVDLTEANVRKILAYSPTYGNNPKVTPCFLRAQLGGVMPDLLRDYLADILQKLFTLILLKNCEYFLAVHATTAILTMALELLQYQSSKVGFHASYDIQNSSINSTDAMSKHRAQTSVEEGIAVIHRLYRLCYSNCHRRLLLTEIPPEISPEQQLNLQQQLQQPAGARGTRGGRRRRTSSVSKKADPHTQTALIYTKTLNRSIAASKPYLEQRASIDLPTSPESSDLTVFFARWLARMYLLKPEENWDTPSH